MKPTIFVARFWSRTWIHEGQTYVYQEDVNDPESWICASIDADSQCPRHCWQGGNLDVNEILFEFTLRDNCREVHFNRRDYHVIYMDDARACPFCGDVEILPYEKNDPRIKQLNLLGAFNRNMSFGDIAIAETIKKLNDSTPAFRFRACCDCRKHMRRPILSGDCPVRRNFRDLPYQKVASSIRRQKDRLSWWETKLICHGKKLPKIAFPCVKKAISRRLRRKSLSRHEHEYLSMLMSASSIKRLLA